MKRAGPVPKPGGPEEHEAVVPDGERVFVGLGANLGDARTAVAQALDALAALPQTRLVAVSRFRVNRQRRAPSAVTRS